MINTKGKILLLLKPHGIPIAPCWFSGDGYGKVLFSMSFIQTLQGNSSFTIIQVNLLNFTNMGPDSGTLAHNELSLKASHLTEINWIACFQRK